MSSRRREAHRWGCCRLLQVVDADAEGSPPPPCRVLGLGHFAEVMQLKQVCADRDGGLSDQGGSAHVLIGVRWLVSARIHQRCVGVPLATFSSSDI